MLLFYYVSDMEADG